MKTKTSMIVGAIFMLTMLVSCEKETTQIQPADQDETVNLKHLIPGTGTIGYWKNHPEAWPIYKDTGEDMKLYIGEVWYTKDETIAIMNKAIKGDKRLNMFNQLAAAMLNVKIHNPSACIDNTIWKADVFMIRNPLDRKKPVKANSKAWKEPYRLDIDTPAINASEVHAMLDAYNNGELCAPHRDNL